MRMSAEHSVEAEAAAARAEEEEDELEAVEAPHKGRANGKIVVGIDD